MNTKENTGAADDQTTRDGLRPIDPNLIDRLGHEAEARIVDTSEPAARQPKGSIQTAD